MSRIALTSSSAIKKKALLELWDDVKTFEIESGIAEQPFGQSVGHLGAETRYKNLLGSEKFDRTQFDYIISIENSIYFFNDVFYERCDAILYDLSDNKVYESKLDIQIDDRIGDFVSKAKSQTPEDYKHKKTGFSVTIGSLVNKKHRRMNKNDWTRDFNGYGFGRVGQIQEALKSQYISLHVKKSLRIVPDFPQEGIFFKDISPLLNNNVLYNQLIGLYAQYIKQTLSQNSVYTIVALDARGFIFGSSLATLLNSPLVMVRKEGKLPPPYEEYSYQKEYGSSDTFCIAKDILEPETSCILIDDILATGNSLFAAAKLVESVNCKVEHMIVLTDVSVLRENADKLLKDYNVKVFL